MNKVKRQYTLSDRCAQRLFYIGRLYKQSPDELIQLAVGSMWAASFGSYNQATRAEMLRALDNGTQHETSEEVST